jgi:hypothetical protein
VTVALELVDLAISEACRDSRAGVEKTTNPAKAQHRPTTLYLQPQPQPQPPFPLDTLTPLNPHSTVHYMRKMTIHTIATLPRLSAANLSQILLSESSSSNLDAPTPPSKIAIVDVRDDGNPHPHPSPFPQLNIC